MKLRAAVLLALALSTSTQANFRDVSELEAFVQETVASHAKLLNQRAEYEAKLAKNLAEPCPSDKEFEIHRIYVRLAEEDLASATLIPEKQELEAKLASQKSALAKIQQIRNHRSAEESGFKFQIRRLDKEIAAVESALADPSHALAVRKGARTPDAKPNKWELALAKIEKKINGETYTAPDPDATIGNLAKTATMLVREINLLRNSPEEAKKSRCRQIEVVQGELQENFVEAVVRMELSRGWHITQYRKKRAEVSALRNVAIAAAGVAGAMVDPAFLIVAGGSLTAFIGNMLSNKDYIPAGHIPEEERTITWRDQAKKAAHFIFSPVTAASVEIAFPFNDAEKVSRETLMKHYFTPSLRAVLGIKDKRAKLETLVEALSERILPRTETKALVSLRGCNDAVRDPLTEIQDAFKKR